MKKVSSLEPQGTPMPRNRVKQNDATKKTEIATCEVREPKKKGGEKEEKDAGETRRQEKEG